MLEYLYQQHKAQLRHFGDKLLLTASGEGSMDCLKYIYENIRDRYYLYWMLDKSEKDYESREQIIHVCELAILGGNVKCLEFLHQKGFPLNSSLYVAARKGNLECFKYLIESGCQAGPIIFNICAEMGHLEIIKYAHAKGFKWDFRVILAAKDARIAKFFQETECN